MDRQREKLNKRIGNLGIWRRALENFGQRIEPLGFGAKNAARPQPPAGWHVDSTGQVPALLG